MPLPRSSGCYRFGVFEVDSESGELRKQGTRIKLHDQPFKILVTLLENPGQLITRDDLCGVLWPDRTHVESELGINTAVMKLRAALGDSAETPRFVETIPRRGYRFLVPVESLKRANAIAVDSPSRDTTEPNKVSPESTSDTNRTSPVKPGTTRLIAAAVVGTALLVGSAWWYLRSRHQPYVIAVLPLQNLNPEPGSDYFSDGLTDEIINNLSEIQGLELKSQTSSFAFKGKSPGIHAVGEQLGANLILEGSVLRTEDKLRVDVQLIRVADDRSLWSGHYQREPKDVFAIQDDISRSIANELRLSLSHGQRRYNTDVDAYDRYLKARALADRLPGWEHEKVEASLPLFEQTIALDPNFAPAYAGIADAYAYLSETPRSYSPVVAFPKMKEACEKALHLDPLLAEAYACAGVLFAREHSWREAENAFQKVFELNPNLARSHEDYAIFVLLPQGRMEETERELRTAIKLDPLSSRSSAWLGWYLLFARRYDEVIRCSQRVLRTDPEDIAAQQNYARALVQLGRFDEGIALLERLEPGSEAFLGYAYARVGRRAEAERIITLYPQWPWIEAIVAGGLGDKDRALDGLEKMALIQDPRLGTYARLPELDLVRGEPRLIALRKAQNLPDL